MSEENNEVADHAVAILDAQLKSQGVGVITVDDGNVFLFSEHMLQNLLEKAQKNEAKKVMIFVKRQTPV